MVGTWLLRLLVSEKVLTSTYSTQCGGMARARKSPRPRSFSKFRGEFISALEMLGMVYNDRRGYSVIAAQVGCLD